MDWSSKDIYFIWSLNWMIEAILDSAWKIVNKIEFFKSNNFYYVRLVLSPTSIAWNKMKDCDDIDQTHTTIIII